MGEGPGMGVMRHVRQAKARSRARRDPPGADFAHHGAKLVIEVDGGRHDLPEAQLHDAERDAWLVAQGYRVMRVKSREAYEYPYDLAERVAAEIQR